MQSRKARSKNSGDDVLSRQGDLQQLAAADRRDRLLRVPGAGRAVENRYIRPALQRRRGHPHTGGAPPGRGKILHERGLHPQRHRPRRRMTTSSRSSPAPTCRANPPTSAWPPSSSSWPRSAPSSRPQPPTFRSSTASSPASARRTTSPAGESTFLVEMNETAIILNNATERSLIIMDEVGRGTSTYDGLSIAWAVVEYILRYLRAKTLFATHYHELTQLGKRRGSSTTTCWCGSSLGRHGVEFLHKVARGAADKSYGIHVAQLAGIPKQIITQGRDDPRAPRKQPRSRSRPPRKPIPAASSKYSTRRTTG